ncbi:MAG: phosphoglycerate dehydrogenase [Lachnospiraceae bacterium]|nr:phosphoglycerate dehydrogenase [Lachnospiraceae bacterium]MBQ1597363.1 phosphoglycerate dehydrogenase [Lachnospiraceae bacterium]MEE3356364.1 phosphoglycerate dehydrogenase [Candidatus Weimeria sp.]
MFTYNTLNAISPKGLVRFTTNFKATEDVQEADSILVRSAKMHDMEFSDKLACIARAGAGVNNIPLDRCAQEGIVVFNTPGANSNAVKEMVFTGMLLASRDVIGGNKWVEENKDNENIAKDMEKAKKNFAGTELAGKKLGVIGLGAIGVKVANAATHFGMEVYGYDPYISVNAAWNLSRSVKHVTNVDDIYRECDFITVHVPLLDSTKEMINTAAINQMKKGVIILNFARDLLVDEKAVVAGLASGKVRHYVSDFPNPVTAGVEGVIATPHLGASTEEAEENCAEMAVDEIMDYMENGNIRHSVNYPDCDMGICNTAGRLAILHSNKSGLIAKYTTILGDANINVADMTNKSRGEYAYALLDVDSPVAADVVEKLTAVDGVIRVRIVK